LALGFDPAPHQRARRLLAAESARSLHGHAAMQNYISIYDHKNQTLNGTISYHEFMRLGSRFFRGDLIGTEKRGPLLQSFNCRSVLRAPGT
jgi:hypothetical protein